MLPYYRAEWRSKTNLRARKTSASRHVYSYIYVCISDVLEPVTHKARTKLPGGIEEGVYPASTRLLTLAVLQVSLSCAPCRLPPPVDFSKEHNCLALSLLFWNGLLNAGRLMFAGTLYPHGIHRHDSPLRSKIYPPSDCGSSKYSWSNTRDAIGGNFVVAAAMEDC